MDTLECNVDPDLGVDACAPLPSKQMYHLDESRMCVHDDLDLGVAACAHYSSKVAQHLVEARRCVHGGTGQPKGLRGLLFLALVDGLRRIAPCWDVETMKMGTSSRDTLLSLH